ncbi:MAG TPA: ribonuclease domain-containing protein [Casimicrobiaceae bacterium]|nr:ribonuclease domain-containing protein [Casimicrobiaceae bacterium]
MPFRPAAVRRSLAALALVAVATWLLAAALPTHAREHGEAQPELAVDELPSEARDTLARIHAGGPFRFERDGVTFGNRERQLPQRERGYYHEYTVVTPGLRTRGARRIICGGARTAPDACWYTGDHYRTFRRIRE